MLNFLNVKDSVLMETTKNMNNDSLSWLYGKTPLAELEKGKPNRKKTAQPNFHSVGCLAFIYKTSILFRLRAID